MNWLRTAVVLLAGCLTAHVGAEVPVSAYLDTANTSADKQKLALYVAGALSGFMWANANLENRKLPALFCPPRKLSLNGENAVALIDEWVKRPEFEVPAAREMSITAVLLSALQDQFPCKP